MGGEVGVVKLRSDVTSRNIGKESLVRTSVFKFRRERVNDLIACDGALTCRSRKGSAYAELNMLSNIQALLRRSLRTNKLLILGVDAHIVIP